MNKSQIVKPEAISLLKDAVVVIPAVHLLASFFYLFFYYYTFGSELALFSGPSDILAVSLSEIGPIYIFGGIGLLIGYWSRPDGDTVNGKNETNKGEKSQTDYLILFCIVSSVMIFILGVASYLLLGYINIYSFALSATVMMVYFIVRFLSGSGLPKFYFMILSSIGLIFLMISFRGMDDGQKDRMISYNNAEKSHPTCSEFVILRNISDKYLAVKNDQSRILLDENCTPIVVLIPSKRATIFSEVSAIDKFFELF